LLFGIIAVILGVLSPLLLARAIEVKMAVEARVLHTPDGPSICTKVASVAAIGRWNDDTGGSAVQRFLRWLITMSDGGARKSAVR
jgi:hypothetical protein